jgi:hypothetical protein
VTRLAALSSPGSSLPGVSSLVNVPSRPIPRWHSGSLLFRGLSPPCSATRLVAERSLLAVGVCVTHPVSQAAMAPILDFEVFFRSGDAGFLAWCYPPLDLAPLFRFCPPLGPESPSWRRSTEVADSFRSWRWFSGPRAAPKRNSSLWSPRLQRVTGEMVWRPSPGLAAPLEVSSL